MILYHIKAIQKIKMCFNRKTAESDIPRVTMLQQEMQDYSAFT